MSNKTERHKRVGPAARPLRRDHFPLKSLYIISQKSIRFPTQQ